MQYDKIRRIEVPIISDFYGIIIRMYFKDTQQHHLPHLHANYNEYIGIFDFQGNLIDGKFLKSQKKIVQAWIEIHHKELDNLWSLLVEGKEGFKIEPLK